MSRNKVPSVEQLERINSEMSDFIKSQNEDIKNLSSEIQYANDFIKWKGLEDEYLYFIRNAHIECPDNQPFGSYVL